MTRRAILSDIHGNLVALRAVLEDIGQQNVDQIICLGDIVGYGPEPAACVDIAETFAVNILGNHDLSALFDPEGFNSAAEQAIFWTRRQLEQGADGPEASRRRLKFICELPRLIRHDSLLLVHGSARAPTTEYVFPEDTYNRKKMEKLFAMIPGICFQGHTHVPGIFTHDLRFLKPAEINHRWTFSPGQKAMVNVGSVGQPRDGDPRSCYVVQDEEVLEFRRVEYDVEQTVEKILAEPELDDFLGHRLRDGR